MALVIPLVFFALVWVLFILPQQRRVRAHQSIVSRLAVGQEVMTTAGLFGVITALDDDEARLEVAPGVELRFARAAVSTVLPTVAPSAVEPATDGADVEPLADPSSRIDLASTGELAPPESPQPVAPVVSGPVVQPRRGVLRRSPRDAAT